MFLSLYFVCRKISFTQHIIESMSMKKISANIVDVLNQRIFPGTITVANGRIESISENEKHYEHYIIPGFVDAHIHIESSLLPPSEFARIAVKHGTLATVSDPHEIANVLGIEGIRFMIENAENTPLKFNFSAPSCVPATPFETAGAALSAQDIDSLFQEFPEIKYLGEMMNYPGVINKDPDVLDKIAVAEKYHKPIDGHAPGLAGQELKSYINAGINTDHECIGIDEAREKLSLGMKILIRRGSAADNFDELIDLAEEHSENCMFCSDDKHPDDLLTGHINAMVKDAVERGINIMKVLKIASVNPVRHYGLDLGLLQEGDPADFLLVDSLTEFKILRSVIDGKLVCADDHLRFPRRKYKSINNFNICPVKEDDFCCKASDKPTAVIDVVDGQLITYRSAQQLKSENNYSVSDMENDILKIAVINRYRNCHPVVSFVRNFGLKSGAIASSVAHDSHNIIVVGVSETDMCKAANMIIQNKGGLSVACEEKNIADILQLPIAGLMSDQHYERVCKKYIHIDKLAKQLGSGLKSPFMALSFMALLVMPEIKLSDKGLFDVNTFSFIS